MLGQSYVKEMTQLIPFKTEFMKVVKENSLELKDLLFFVIIKWVLDIFEWETVRYLDPISGRFHAGKLNFNQ